VFGHEVLIADTVDDLIDAEVRQRVQQQVPPGLEGVGGAQFLRVMR
jgi:hypothetical protein